MGKGKNKGYPKLGFLGDSKRFTRLHDDRIESDAFQVLAAQSQASALILMDMDRAYSRASFSDTESVTANGFMYAWASCTILVTDKTFYKAVKEICRLGFYRRAPELEPNRPLSGHIYVPDRAWKDYHPTRDERRLLNRKKASKSKRVKDQKQRKAEAISK